MTIPRSPSIAAAVLSGSLAVSMAATAHAADTAPAPSPQLREAMARRVQAADANHDGFLDRAEAKSGTPRLFSRFDDVDSDHDGRLSPQELQAVAALAGQMMAGKR